MRLIWMRIIARTFAMPSMLCCALWHAEVQAQGTFQNLGFESATNLPSLPSGQPAFVPFANAFPGWAGTLGTNQATTALYNGFSLGAVEVTLIGRGTANYSNDVIAGNYSAVLQAGFDGFSIVPASISQPADIPASAASLRFAASGIVGDMSLSFNGQPLTFVELGAGPNYATYGADVSAFSGQAGELRFTEQPITGSFSTAFLDSIQFSTQSIPEPSAVSLAALAAAACCLWKSRGRMARRAKRSSGRCILAFRSAQLRFLLRQLE
jgi:hypothetical protein